MGQQIERDEEFEVGDNSAPAIISDHKFTPESRHLYYKKCIHPVGNGICGLYMAAHSESSVEPKLTDNIDPAKVEYDKEQALKRAKLNGKGVTSTLKVVGDSDG